MLQFVQNILKLVKKIRPNAINHPDRFCPKQRAVTSAPHWRQCVDIDVGAHVQLSYEQTRAVAAAVSRAGVRVLRGGAFKPRTSPHTFQGLGLEGLEILRAVADEFGLLVANRGVGR